MNPSNNLTLIGRLARDPELRYTPNNKAVVNGTLAVRRAYPNANGEYESDFIQFVIWGKRAEALTNYTGKGSLISIAGALQTRNYENADGQRIYVTEVAAESWTPLENKETNQARLNGRQPQQRTQSQAGEMPTKVDPDELTFGDPAALGQLGKGGVEF